MAVSGQGQKDVRGKLEQTQSLGNFSERILNGFFIDSPFLFWYRKLFLPAYLNFPEILAMETQGPS